MRINRMSLFAIAAFSVSCGGTGGQRQMRLQPTQGIVVSDASLEVLPAFTCSGSAPVTYDCSMPFPLHPDGHITDLSYREWNSGSGTWCDESGFHGKVYSYTNTAVTADTHSSPVTDGSLHLVLSVTGGQYGGGGVQFAVASVGKDNLANCPLQLQLATFDQRPTNQMPAGGCNADAGVSCFGYPAASNIAVTSTDA